jgi:hypothetical protein
MSHEQPAIEEPKVPAGQEAHPEDEMLKKVLESKSSIELSDEELADLEKKDSDDYMRGGY